MLDKTVTSLEAELFEGQPLFDPHLEPKDHSFYEPVDGRPTTLRTPTDYRQKVFMLDNLMSSTGLTGRATFEGELMVLKLD